MYTWVHRMFSFLFCCYSKTYFYLLKNVKLFEMVFPDVISHVRGWPTFNL